VIKIGRGMSSPDSIGRRYVKKLTAIEPPNVEQSVNKRHANGYAKAADYLVNK